MLARTTRAQLSCVYPSLTRQSTTFCAVSSRVALGFRPDLRTLSGRTAYHLVHSQSKRNVMEIRAGDVAVRNTKRYLGVGAVHAGADAAFAPANGVGHFQAAQIPGQHQQTEAPHHIQTSISASVGELLQESALVPRGHVRDISIFAKSRIQRIHAVLRGGVLFVNVYLKAGSEPLAARGGRCCGTGGRRTGSPWETGMGHGGRRVGGSCLDGGC